jgi:Flp pilus assembly pilin Flp
VRLWITLWGGRMAAHFTREDGNVFIENGIWIIVVVLAMILPIEALRNALVNAFGQITNNLGTIQ